MTIGVIGLGLIGGSIAKAISDKTSHEVLGYDINKSVVCKAKLLNAIYHEFSLQTPPVCDIIILALYPQATIEVFKQIAPLLRKNTIVIDCCGIKEKICDKIERIASKYEITFIGGHPMAGIEQIGFEFSCSDLFNNASMILTPSKSTDIKQLALVKNLFEDIGFSHTTIVSPEEHDRVIAYTSQLAHILSSAYIKSPTASSHKGMSAGSFKDMTRVAYLNEVMWSELFMSNSKNLLYEIDTLIRHLTEYKTAIEENDCQKLTELLRDGRIKKERI